MYKVEWEKIDGTSGDWHGQDGDVRVFARDELDEAEIICENLWSYHSGGGRFAVFRVINMTDDTIYSELECD